MDLNAKIFINNNQKNKLLLNAIKDKFDAETATVAAAYSPPKFNIPLLKIPGGNTLENINPNHENSNTQTDSSSNSSTQLNQFLLKQLQEKHTNNELSKQHKGFVWPKLQTSSVNKTAVKFELPVLKPQSASTSMGTLTTAIDKLKVQESSCEDDIKSVPPTPTTIDLTTALAIKFETHQGTPPSRDFVKSQRYAKLDFEIPFIHCDRLDISGKNQLLLPASNEYCVTDVSQLLLQHSLTEPSAIGRFLCIADNKYLDPLPLKNLPPYFCQQKMKHCIEPFHFDTKSPDDLVLLALSKHHRRHIN